MTLWLGALTRADSNCRRNRLLLNSLSSNAPLASDTSAATSWKRRAVWCLLLAMLCAPPALYGYMATFTTNSDPFLYAQVAKEMLASRSWTSRTWQDKPPLVYASYALPQMIIPGSYRAIACFGGLCTAIECAMYAYVFRRHPPAMLAVTSFVCFAPMTHFDYIWPSTEWFSNLFVAGSVLLGFVIHRAGHFSTLQCVLIGMLACLAFHVRQNTVLCTLIPIVAVLQAGSSLKRTLLALTSICLGGLLVWSAILLVMFWAGDVNAYLWSVFIYPRRYVSVGSFSQLIQLWWHLWTSPLAFVFVLFTTLALFRKQDWVFVLAAASIGLIVPSCTMRCHFHYWVSSFPYAAVVIGIAIQRCEERDELLARRLTIATIGFFVVTAAMQCYISNEFSTRYSFYADVATKVDQAVLGDGTLLVVGRDQSEAVQFASRLNTANPFAWVLEFREPWVRTLPLPLDDIIAQYLNSPPDVIVADQDFVMRANSSLDTQSLSGDARLLRSLTRRFDYKVVDKQGPFMITVRTK